MAVSFVGQASAAATSVTLPTTQTGDLIIIFAFRNTTTAPSLPAGWTNLATQSANGVSFRIGYKYAAASDVSGTWTNANVVEAVVYRGASIGGVSSGTNAASTSDAITGVGTMVNADGSSWAVSFSGSLQTTSMSTPGGGTLRGVNQAGTGCMAMVFDSNAGVASWAQHTSTLGASAASGGGSVEILDNPIIVVGAPNTGGSTSGANISLTSPTGVAAGDVLVIAVSERQQTDGVTAISDGSGHSFTKMNFGAQATTSSTSIWYRVVLAGDGTTWTLTNSANAEAAILCFRNVDNVTPIDAQGTTNTTSSASGTVNAVTTVTAKAMLVGVIGENNAAGPVTVQTSPAQPALAIIVSAGNGGATTTRQGVSVMLGTVSAVGSSGAYVFTLSLSNNWGSYGFALRPSTGVTTTKTITGVARITAATLKTIAGISRITATTLKTITGVARVQITTLKTITGISRITVSTPKTITGLANIRNNTLRTITGVARVTNTTLKTITGVANVTLTTLKTVTGISRITVSTLKTISGIARITNATLKTITGKARITVSTPKTITGLARITAATLKTVTGVARLTNSTLKTVSGVARITNSTLKTITGKARITVSTPKTIAGVARITNTTLKTITGIARITITTLKTISGKARITASTSKTVTGLSRITATTLKTITGVANITGAAGTTLKTITGKARIAVTTLKTISGVARITQTASQVVTGIARITATAVKTITGVARIQTSTNKTITGKSRVSITTLQTLQGKADIRRTTQQTIVGVARVGITSNQTITGVARIIDLVPLTARRMTLSLDDWTLSLTAKATSQTLSRERGVTLRHDADSVQLKRDSANIELG